jgi:hypothetical protein
VALDAERVRLVDSRGRCRACEQRRGGGRTSADPDSKSRPSVSTRTARPRFSIDRLDLALQALLGDDAVDRALSCGSPPARLRLGRAAVTGASVCGLGRCSRTEPPVCWMDSPPRMRPENASDSDCCSDSNFDWLTLLIANMTMKSAMSSVIMSA